MAKIQNFLIGIGYAEDARLAFIPMIHHVGFDSPVYALRDIKRILKEDCERERAVFSASRDKGSCCEGQLGTFCSTCGRRLIAEVFIATDEDVAEYFVENFGGTNDDLSYLWEVFSMEGWDFELGEKPLMVVAADRIIGSPDEDMDKQYEVFN